MWERGFERCLGDFTGPIIPGGHEFGLHEKESKLRFQTPFCFFRFAAI